MKIFSNTGEIVFCPLSPSKHAKLFILIFTVYISEQNNSHFGLRNTKSCVQLQCKDNLNSSRKSVYCIKPLTYKQCFFTLNELKKCIQEEIGPIEDDKMGYIKPGHGQSGKIRDLCDDEHLSEMNVLFKCQHSNMLLWCYDGNVG